MKCLEDLQENLGEFTEIIEDQKWTTKRSERLQIELETFKLRFIEDKQKSKSIIKSQGDEAQEWLDLLQLVRLYYSISEVRLILSTGFVVGRISQYFQT